MSEKIEQFMRITGVTEDEVLTALIGAISPSQPGALRQNWRRNKSFGFDAPTTKAIREMFEDADYRCGKCRSQLRLTLDHRNGDATNHDPTNLDARCFACNRSKSRKPTQGQDHGLRIYKAIIELYAANKPFPTNKEIQGKAGVKQIGGRSTLVRFLKKRLEEFDARKRSRT